MRETIATGRRRAAGSRSAFSASRVLACAASLALPGTCVRGDRGGHQRMAVRGAARTPATGYSPGRPTCSGRSARTGCSPAGFAQMLGTRGRRDACTTSCAACGRTAILPIGCGMLSFVFTVQLIKVSQRMDGNASDARRSRRSCSCSSSSQCSCSSIQNSFDLMAGGLRGGPARDRPRDGPVRNRMPSSTSTAVSITTTDDDVAGAGRHARGRPRELARGHRRLRGGARRQLGARHPDLRRWPAFSPIPLAARLARRDAADGCRLS